MEQWLVDRLLRAGILDAPGEAHRKARAGTCSRCGRAIFYGRDAEFGGVSVEVDPEPLSALGEALALLAHRRTYELWASGIGPMTIDRRDKWRIAGRPAGRCKVDVLVQHTCGQSGKLPTTGSVYPPPVRAADLPDDPPF